MIKDVTNNSPYIYVSGGGGYSPYINMSNTSAGMVRYNGNSNNFEVYDGSSWMMLTSNIASVGLTGEAVGAIAWARQKMDEEENLKKLANDHPAVKIALDNLDKAKQQLDATIILSKEYDTTS